MRWLCCFIFNLLLMVSVPQTSAFKKPPGNGTACVVEGKSGYCTFLKHCPIEEHRVEDLKLPARKACGHIGMKQIVCCERNAPVTVPELGPVTVTEPVPGPMTDSVTVTEPVPEPVTEPVTVTTTVPDMRPRMSGQSVDCNYDGTFPFRCCPLKECPGPPSRPTPNKISNTSIFIMNKCEEHSTMIEACVKISSRYCKIEIPHDLKPRIIYGEKARAAEFPHMALLGYKNYYWANGGTLISERAVLTAAHVLDLGIEKGQVQFVCLGLLYRTKACKGKSTYKVKKFICHPDYDYPKLENDIGVLLLDRSVRLTDRVRPACLPVMQSDISSDLTVIGWGVTGENVQSKILLKTGIQERPAAQCEKDYRPYGRLRDGWKQDNLFCTVGLHDSCQGDSGGPVTRQLKNMTCSYELVGIVSFGVDCGQGGPAVYTRVSGYTDWIVQKVWNKLK